MPNKFPYYYGAGEVTFQKAKSLRKDLTPAEDFLWQALRNRGIENFKFRRQHPVGPFIVDFFCNAAELVVEVDGGIHDVPKVKEYDEQRETYLKSLGLTVLRFRNEEVLMNIDVVLGKIGEYLKGRLPSPRPSPKGEGGLPMKR